MRFQVKGRGKKQVGKQSQNERNAESLVVIRVGGDMDGVRQCQVQRRRL